MTSIRIVSPHADDAVWSICEHMLTWVEDGYDVTVIVVHGGMPTDTKGISKHSKLDDEHAKVMSEMGITSVALDFLDNVYPPRPGVTQLTGALRPLLDGADYVVGPRGIHHPDHVATSLAVSWLSLDLPETRIWIYEELPYYVLYPRGEMSQASYTPVGCREHLLDKKRLCRMYESQMATDDVERCIYVPERVWEAWRKK